MYRNRLTLPPHCTQTLSLTSASSLTLGRSITLPPSLTLALQHHFNPFPPLVPFPVIAPSCVWLHAPALAIFCLVHIVKHTANSENLFNLLKCLCTYNESVLCSVLGHCAPHHWLLQLLLTLLTSLLWCSHTCAGGSETC